MTKVTYWKEMSTITMMVLGDSKFEFRFLSFILLWSMDDRAEAEFKIAVARYQSIF